MNKKQLSLQNASLFAELERKAKEMEILNIRLEDANKKIDLLNTENEETKVLIAELKSENNELEAQVERLEKALAEAESRAVQTFAVFNTTEPEPTLKEENDSNIEIIADGKNDIAQEIFERFYGEGSSDSAKVTEPSESTAEAATENTYEPTAVTEDNYSTEDEANDNEEAIVASEDSPAPTATAEESAFAIKQTANYEAEGPTPTADLLRDYGARIIGKVTRVTAEVLSKISTLNDDVSESLKTLALGKNESFKFQIMELAKSKTDPEKVMTEMDLLADEAIVYLRSI